MLGTRLHVTPYTRQHRSALLDLCFHSHWTHQHLDWYAIGEWTDQERGKIFLAWQGADLAGFIGLSQPSDGHSWIRLLGVRDGRMPGLIVDELWERAAAHSRRTGVAKVSILMLTNWLPNYLGRLGFAYADEVIALSYIGSRLPAPPETNLEIRAAEAADIERIAEIDRLAFAPRWRLARDEVRQALRICPLATVAVRDSALVAYQFSTRHDDVGHLARLAVSPKWQRQGIATQLLFQAMRELRRQPLTTISLNTQLSNPPSQKLYQRFGFFRNGNDIEMWQRQIE